mgnify:CR=1 FL=1
MIAIVLIGLAAGCASALMFASIISGALISLLLFYLAPHLLGSAARGMLDLGDLEALDQRLNLEIRETRMFGPDLRILARPHAGGKGR